MIAYVRMVDGAFRKHERILAMQNGTEADIDDIGFFRPAMTAVQGMEAGDVGYLITGIKDVAKLRVGDTLTALERPRREPLEGYREVRPMVFCGLFPIDTDRYEDLRDALEKLALNDAALSWEPETSEALGFGFRCGFLGLLHMEIVRERLEREYGLDLLATTPNVRYEVHLTNGEEIEVHSPTDLPDPGTIEAIEEPYIRATIICPSEQVGAVMELCQGRRGTHVDMHYLSPQRVQIRYDMPLAEIVLDFFDLLKSSTTRLRLARLRADRQPGLRPGQGRHPARRRQGRRALDHRPPRLLLRAGQAPGRAAAQDDPAPALRRAGAGRDRLQHPRPRDGQGAAQGRHREALRRRRHPQAEAAEEAEGGQEADEVGRAGGSAAGGVSGGLGD